MLAERWHQCLRFAKLVLLGERQIPDVVEGANGIGAVKARLAQFVLIERRVLEQVVELSSETVAVEFELLFERARFYFLVIDHVAASFSICM